MKQKHARPLTNNIAFSSHRERNRSFAFQETHFSCFDSPNATSAKRLSALTAAAVKVHHPVSSSVRAFSLVFLCYNLILKQIRYQEFYRLTIIRSATDTMSIDIVLKRADRVYRPGEMVSGHVLILSKGAMSHNGITLVMEGLVTLQLSAKSVGMFEAFYNSLKPVLLVHLSAEVSFDFAISGSRTAKALWKTEPLFLIMSSLLLDDR